MTNRTGFLTDDSGSLSGGPSPQSVITPGAASAHEPPAGPGHRARKGRACTSCAKLKMKCKWEGEESLDGSACLRCSRMNLHCTVPEPSQRRTRGKATRVAQLEKKIDGLVNLLTTRNQNNQNIQPPATVPAALLTQGHVECLAPIPSPNSLSEPLCSQPPPPLRPSQPQPQPQHPPVNSELPEIVPGFRITYAKAEDYLTTYRTQYIPKFPFAPVSEQTTASALHHEKPLLFWSIMRVVAPQSSAVQAATKQWFLERLAQQVVVRNEKRLEHVQALLVQIGWGDFHFYVESQVTNLLQLCIALVVDLYLTKAPGLARFGPRGLFEESWAAMNKGPLPFTTPHTLDEIRAVLGCFYINSLVSTLFRRDHQFRFTHYMAKGCEALRDARETNNDLYLVALVRMQCLSDRLSFIFPEPEGDSDDPVVFRPALDVTLSSVRRELNEILDSLPSTVRSNPLLMPLYYNLLTRLYEPVLVMRPSQSCIDSDHRRIEVLWNCLEATKSCFESWLAVPVADHVHAPFIVTALLAFCIITASRLVLAGNIAAWDARLARSKLDLADVIHRLAAMFEAVDAAVKNSGRRRRLLPDGSPTLLKYAYKLRWIRSWYLNKVAAEDVEQQEPNRAQTPSQAQMMDGIQASEFQFDEEFWHNMMAADGLFFSGIEGQQVTAVNMAIP